MRFQIKGLDNVKLSENARLCLESINVPILIDGAVNSKVYGQTIVRMSHLSSINCFDSHGNGQTDPVIFTSQPNLQVVLDEEVAGINSTSTYTTPQVFYNPQPEILYNFPISSNFLNNRYFEFTLIMQFKFSKFIQYDSDQIFFDTFHISFIVYDLDEQELLLTSTQDVDFKKFGETLPRKLIM